MKPKAKKTIVSCPLKRRQRAVHTRLALLVFALTGLFLTNYTWKCHFHNNIASCTDECVVVSLFSSDKSSIRKLIKLSSRDHFDNIDTVVVQNQMNNNKTKQKRSKQQQQQQIQNMNKIDSCVIHVLAKKGMNISIKVCFSFVSSFKSKH